ncbi:radical SAM protein [Amycolatopsis sacchari]|uniref:radical SAM protein n=1 Tax=Amycolatopsis sacchari TaxID=115433 RepID=UPI003EBE201C
MTTSLRTPIIGAPSRFFASGAHDDIRYVHDPLTGLTHRADQLIPLGRSRLLGSEVETWPTIHPSDLNRPAPVSVCWSPLVRCNLACPHCLDDKAVTELNRSERTRIARLLGESDVLAVDISGGEPLLLRELAELVEILTARGRAVSVTTNGWHLQRRAEGLAGVVDAIRISLDGPDDSSHDRWRGRGSFRRATAGIRAAVALGIPTQLQTVLMASTRDSAQRMVDLAAELGTHGVTFLQMLPIGDGAALAPAEQLTDEQAQARIDALDLPEGIAVRLRTRQSAGGFTVIRADGRVWRNDAAGEHIATLHPLTSPADLALTAQDGSA